MKHFFCFVWLTLALINSTALSTSFKWPTEKERIEIENRMTKAIKQTYHGETFKLLNLPKDTAVKSVKIARFILGGSAGLGWGAVQKPLAYNQFVNSINHLNIYAIISINNEQKFMSRITKDSTKKYTHSGFYPFPILTKVNFNSISCPDSFVCYFGTELPGLEGCIFHRPSENDSIFLLKGFADDKTLLPANSYPYIDSLISSHLARQINFEE